MSVLLSPALLKKLPEVWEPCVVDEDWYRDKALEDSLAHCKEVTRHHAKSFYFSSFPLPQAKRYAAYVVYAYCRYVDDVIDEAEEGAILTDAQEELRIQFGAMLAGDDQRQFAPALRKVIDTYRMPEHFFHDLIYGCCLDRVPLKLKTFAELEEYCYYVASVVGLMMSRIFGLNDVKGTRQAVEMGIAMQLTNILRDVKEDLDRGRIYLPAEELEAAGFDESFLQQGKVTPEWRDFMRVQIHRARRYYDEGSKGLALLADDGSQRTTALMARIYSEILTEIERADYNVFAGRVYVPKWRKLWLALTMRKGSI